MLPLFSNLLLQSLSEKDRLLLVAKSHAVPLLDGTNLYTPEVTPRYAYFLTSGLASIVTSMPDGTSADVSFVGHEGVVGGLHILGPGLVSTNCFMQIEGSALRIRLDDLRAAFRASETIRDSILEFVQSQEISLGQLAGCHRLHAAEPRLARWLLMAQDRIGGNVLDLTQESLAGMIGSRRTTVTVAAGIMQRRGLIEYHRGSVRILDRKMLEATACACYPVTHQLLVNLYSRIVVPEAAA